MNDTPAVENSLSPAVADGSVQEPNSLYPLSPKAFLSPETQRSLPGISHE